MKNRRALFSLITSTTVITALVIACSSDDTSTFNPMEKPDTGVGDTGPGFNTDTGKQTEDANATCSPAVPTTFSPSLKAPTVAQACDPGDFSDYFTHCIATDTSGNAKLQATECSDWRTAHDTCSKCIEPTDNTGPVQLFKERLYYAYNFAACVGIVQKDTAKDSCADAFNSVEQCRQEACDNCVGVKGLDGQDLLDCRTAALNKDCATYKAKRDTTCNATGYLDAGSSESAVDCFAQTAGEPEGDVFIRLAKHFCAK